MKKIMTLIMLIVAAMLVISGCAKTTAPAAKADSKDTATTGVTQGISDAENLTSLDDASLEKDLGSADKTLANW